MLVHFMDKDGQFVNVDRAVNLLMSSSTESRRELRSVYGLREAFPPVPIPSRVPQSNPAYGEIPIVTRLHPPPAPPPPSTSVNLQSTEL
uniref:Ras-associating domain-containing protein n=1 Tax=Caenorhabditis tropicalis TaxID=1561998 RepID=A0A1I7TPR3_9PELO